ncbi:tetratricopeptide repeat protein [Longispora urticae]
MMFRALGAVEVVVAGQAVPLGRRGERRLLGLLLLDLGTVLSVERLADQLSEDGDPGPGRGAVHVHVSRLRGRLAGAGADRHGFRLLTRAPGYVLEGDPDLVDIHRFRALSDEANATADPAAKVELLDRALALWQGPLFGADATDRIRETSGALFEELHASVSGARIEAKLALGLHAGVLDELAALCARYPRREALVEARMLALHRSGRRDEALAVAEAARALLEDELGLDPRPELAALRDRILRDDPTLVYAAPRKPGPAQLPPVIGDFVGRDAELERLDGMAPGPDGAPRSSVVISTIAGFGGIGKTALAVHWAHRVRDRFPDGQLYVNLHGYSAAVPVQPIEALARFLRALGVPAEQISPELAEATAQYQAALADRRMLIILDNANHAEQVRPLLPADPGSLAVITSRDRLAALTEADGHRLTLGVLAPAEAVALLARIVGADRIAAEPDAAAEWAALCGHLPLAVRISAALLADRPGRTIAEHAAALRDGGRLAGLQVADDEQASVRATFNQSYDQLTADQRRLFRLLALVPGTDFEAAATASLVGTTAVHAALLLDRLAAAHLIEVAEPGRYAFHDLLRDHARALTEATDPAADRSTAYRRLADHYLHTAAAAMDVLVPHEADRRPRLGVPGTPVAPFRDREHATAWLDAERLNLVVLAGLPGGGPHLASQLSTILYRYLDEQAHYADASVLHGHAIRISGEHDDVAGLADGLRNQGVVYWRLGQFDRAAEHAREALGHHLAIGDRAGAGRALINLGIIDWQFARYGQAAECYLQALEHQRATGDRTGEGTSLINLANLYWQLGRYREAAQQHREAMEHGRELGNRTVEAYALMGLGTVEQRLGNVDTAVRLYLEGLAIQEELGNRTGELNAYMNLGTAHEQAGRFEEARFYFAGAQERCTESGHRLGEVSAQVGLGMVELRSGDLAAALACNLKAEELNGVLQDAEMEVEVRHGLGEVALAEGRYADALDSHQRAHDLAEEAGNRFMLARALDGLGRTQLALGRDGEARELSRGAAELFADMGVPYESPFSA